MPIANALARRVGQLEAARRRVVGEDRPCAIVIATDCEAPWGADICPNANEAVQHARETLHGQRVVFALPDNHRGDSPKVWSAR